MCILNVAIEYPSSIMPDYSLTSILCEFAKTNENNFGIKSFWGYLDVLCQKILATIEQKVKRNEG
jgi:hypothetical protein